MMIDSWLLIAPAKDAGSAREISEAFAEELARVAAQVGLRCTRDYARRKIYLAVPEAPVATATPAAPAAPKSASANALVYPSGSAAERHPENNAARYAPAHPEQAAPLVATATDIMVSKNFRLGEFRPKSSAYNGVRVHPHLVELLEQIRAAAGGAVHITSGYRPPDYNASVGGEPNSYHMDGLAADIYCDHLTTAQLHTVCEKVVGNRGGLGYYPKAQFCHVDVRGYYSRWTG